VGDTVRLDKIGCVFFVSAIIRCSAQKLRSY
jgi:hypothetical protein